MFKFLRKYQSWILVVGGTLLMIAFLVPGAIQNMGADHGSRTAMTLASGRRITEREVQQSNHAYSTLKGTLPGFLYTFRIDPRNSMHWLLNTEAAREAGFLGPRADGADPVFAEMVTNEELQAYLSARYGPQWRMYMQFVPEAAQDAERRYADIKQALAAATSGATTREGLRMDEVVSSLRGVRRMRETFASAPAVSPARLVAEAKKQYDTAIVSYLIAPIDERAIASVPEPTEAEIQAHYEQYRTVKRGEGEFGIGYDMPAQIKVRWLAIDRLKVFAAAEPDPVAVQERVLALPPGDEDPKVRRQRVEMQLKNEMTERAVRAAQEAVKNEILLITSRLPDQPGSRLKAVPAGAPAIDFGALAKLASDKASSVLGAPVELFKVDATPDWQTMDGAARLAGLGNAQLRVGSGLVPAVQVLFQVSELSPANPAPVPVQVGLPVASSFEDFTNERPPRANNAYFAEVFAVRPPGPPASLDEVRAQVITDLKKIALFKRLETTGAALAEQARELSLDDVRASLHTANPAVGQVRQDVYVARAMRDQLFEPGMADDAVIEAIMARAQQIDHTQPVDTKDPKLTFSVPVPKSFAVAIVQITGFDPLTQERYRQVAARARNVKIITDVGDAIDEPFTLPALARHFAVEVGKASVGEE